MGGIGEGAKVAIGAGGDRLLFEVVGDVPAAA
jgi:hypothetical protein